MREIKFRAWDKIDKELLTGDDGSGSYMNDMFGYFDIREDETRYILMQFTGLKDRNGKEIYEGDIVLILYTDWASQPEEDTRTLDEYLDDKSHKGIVCFDYDRYQIKIGDYLERIYPGKHGRITVIGNIYENPELLTKEK